MKQDKCINVEIDGLNVIVRTGDGRVSPEAMSNIRKTIADMRSKTKRKKLGTKKG